MMRFVLVSKRKSPEANFRPGLLYFRLICLLKGLY